MSREKRETEIQGYLFFNAVSCQWQLAKKPDLEDNEHSSEAESENVCIIILQP